MRSIWHIYKTDWLRIWKVPTGIFLIAAITLLPSLYDWVNIKSVWDPYSNTHGIKIAVTSLDGGAVVAGKTVRIGDDLLESLKHNEKLGWTFVDEAQAQRGVEDGSYYASLLVPADFSAKITGIAEGKLDRPEVIYTVNEKVNAIASKITGSGVSAITKQINESFTEAVSEAVLSRLKEAGIELEEQLPSLRRMESGLFALESSLPAIEAAGQKVLEVESKLPEISEKAQKLIAIEEKLPEINEAAQGILKLQQHWPQISAAASEILAVQQRLPDIQKAVSNAQELAVSFDKVSGIIAEELDKTKQAADVVAAAEERLAGAGDTAANAKALADGINEFLSSNQESFNSVVPVIRQNLLLLKQLTGAAALVTDRLLGADPDRLPTAAELQAASDRLAAGGRVIENMSELLGVLNRYLPGEPLGDAVARLNHVAGTMNRQVQLLADAAETVANGGEAPKELAERLNALAKETASGLEELLLGLDSELAPAIVGALEKMRQAAALSADALQAAKERLPDVEALLDALKSGIAFSQTELKQLQADLPAIRAKAHEAAQLLQSKTAAFADVMNTLAPLVSDKLPAAAKKLDAAAAYVQSGLPEAEQELKRAADFARYQLPEAERDVRRAAQLVREDLPQLEEAVRKAADKLREVEGNNHFAELARLLRGDIAKESEFLASPVQIKENRLYAIPNYGSAMSPFYGVLSLWVGATLLISLLRSEADNPGGRFKGYQLYLGRLATFLTIGLLQALIVTLGDIYILGAFVADKLWFVLFALLVSVVFVTITYTLLSVFGNAGKGLAIVFMVFQFSSSGGTFPVSMTSPFFQRLNPFMPFTYAIGLLREAVGGIWWPTVHKDLLCLLGFLALCLIVALALKRPLEGITKRSAEKAKETNIIA